jgi:hypothetical protein
MNAVLEEKKARLALVNELRASGAYRAILLPHFAALARHHAGECRNKSLPWEKRAEHIEAAELAERLGTYLDERAAALETQMEALRE